ncbi:DUF5723 family protein [Halocola ammonii]
MRLSTLLTFLFLATFQAFAQDNLGIVHSNYSPVNTVHNNPASIVDSKAFIDFQLVGFGVFAKNNLAYLPKDEFRFSDTWQNPDAVPEPVFGIPSNNSRAHANVSVRGPSVSFAVGKNSFALTTQVRSVTDLRRVPDHLVRYMENGLQWEPQMGESFSARNVSFASLNWAEVGLSYGRIVHQRGNDMITAGISLKYLLGFAGGGVRIDRWDYTVLDSTNLETTRFQGEFGFNEPGEEALFNGRGIGADIGVVFKRTTSNVESYTPHSPRQGCRTSDYEYKLGVSILDLGRIRFNDPFYGYSFDISDPRTWEDYPSFSPDGADGISNGLAEEFALNDGGGEISNLRIKLPTAISLQYDHKVMNNVYLGGHWIQGFPRRNSLGPQRPAQVAFIPRFETKRFEASMPLILHEYSSGQIGLMLRLNSIVIGTDNLGAFLFNQDVYGADFYFSLKYTIFRSWKCAKKSRSRGRGRGGRSIPPCPSW